MSRPVFITGTDTGVGKTFVTGGICLLARRAKLRVGVMKPVETGCTPHRGKLLPADATLLSTQAGDADSLDDVCPYRFEAPISPETAALQAGVDIEFSRIAGHFKKIAGGKDLTLVEGAGGILVPLSRKKNMADLAKHLKCRVLLVVGDRLGMINHALLSISEIKRRRLPLAGIVLNRVVPPDSGDESLKTNAQDLARHTDVPIFGTLPWLPEGPGLLKPFRYRKLLEDHLDSQALLAALRK